MKRSILCLWLATTATIGAAQSSDKGAGIELRDPEALSGWIRVELAVLTDSSPAQLASETWPATPQVRYPAQWRWLDDLDKRAELAERFPGATIVASERGELTVTLPSPAAPEPEFPTGRVADSIDPLTGLETETPVADAVPLEAISATSTPTREPADADVGEWLEPFAETTSLTEAAASMESDDSESIVPEQSDRFEAPAPPPEPLPFTARPTSMLAEGLVALERQRGTPAALQTAWVQPPGAKNLPIVLDTSGDDAFWPALQGFVELRRSSELRVGINFWFNTQGSYLPPGFAIDPPPRGPSQIRVLEAPREPLIGTEFGPGVDLAVRGGLRAAGNEFAAGNTTTQGAISYIDPATGFEMTAPPGDVAVGTSSTNDWLYRHFLHVADTRAVPENGVRYFDHPVIQTVVTWRELTWGEVWAMGEADRSRLAELLPPKATTEDALVPPPAGVVPPSMREFQ